MHITLPDNPSVHSELSQTSKMEVFTKIIWWLKAVNYFSKKLHLRCPTKLWIRCCNHMLSRHCAVSENNVEISWKLIFCVHILVGILLSVNFFWNKKAKYHIIWLFSAKVNNKQYSKVCKFFEKDTPTFFPVNFAKFLKVPILWNT